jgi:hypothetical protein
VEGRGKGNGEGEGEAVEGRVEGGRVGRRRGGNRPDEVGDDDDDDDEGGGGGAGGLPSGMAALLDEPSGMGRNQPVWGGEEPSGRGIVRRPIRYIPRAQNQEDILRAQQVLRTAVPGQMVRVQPWPVHVVGVYPLYPL